MSETYFTSHIFQDAATVTSAAFCEVLTPLVPPNDVSMSDTAPIAQFLPEHEGKTTRQPGVSLPELFSEAIVRSLTLKQNLTLSRTKYQLVFFRPGQQFDPQSMIRDGEGYSAFDPAQMRGKRNSWPGLKPLADGARISLCVFPALYSKDEEDLETLRDRLGVTVTSCLVKSDNFVRDATDIPGEGFELVVKGVVMV